jgi:fucose permease
MNVISLFLALSAFSISANAVPPLISTMVETTGIRAPNFGFFIFIQYVAFSLIAFTGSSIKNKLRLSNYFVVAIGLIAITISLILGGVLLHSYLALLIWVIPLGLSGAAVEVFASIELSNLSDFNSSKNLCLSQVFYSLGAFAAPQIVYFCFDFGMEWESIFFIFSLVSVLVLFFFLVINQHRLRFESVSNKFQSNTKAVILKTVNSRRLFLIFLLIMMSYVIIESLSAAWLAYSFEQEFQLNTKNAALVLAAFWGGMVLSRFLIVMLPARLTLWPTLLVSSVLLLLATVIILPAPGYTASFIAVIVMGISAGPIWPVVVMLSASIFRSEKKTASVIGMGALGFAMGPLVGAFIINTGSIQKFHYAQTLLAIVVVILTYTAYLLYRKIDCSL